MSELAGAGGPVVFERIRAEAFRGFAAPIELDLNASVVIVHGPNGFGKTSLFDALQWVLVGDLARLREIRLRQTDEHIVSAYRAGEKATVEVDLRLRGERVRLRRTGDRSGSTLTWSSEAGATVHGADAEALLSSRFSGNTDLSMAAALSACGLLQQDAAREILTTKPRDRFDTFSKLLGLGELSEVQQWTRSAYDRAASDLKAAEVQTTRAANELAQANGALTVAHEISAARPIVADVAERLLALIQSVGFAITTPIDSRDLAVAVAASASSLAREGDATAQELRRLAAEGPLLFEVEAVDLDLLTAERREAESALAEARIQLERARAELNASARLHSSLETMVNAVLPHVHEPSCPVCGQAVDPEELRSRLMDLAGTNSTTDAQQQVAVLTEIVEVARTALNFATQAEHDEVDRHARRAQWQLARERSLARVQTLNTVAGPIQIRPIETASADMAPMLEALAAAAARVAALARELVTAWDASASSDEAAALTAVQRLQARQDMAQSRREQLALANNAAAALQDGVRLARLDVVRLELDRLTPLAQDIYSRLNPHPSFRDIDLVSDMYRAVGTTVARVHDSLLDVAADPMLVFSSAQSNIAAISYLIALNLAASVGAPVLMLDDPLQAMDDVNVLGFADLCRHVRLQRQLFISTHEKRFAQLLERKLAPRTSSDRTIVLEFVGWDRNGPTVKPRDLPDQSDQIGTAFDSAR